MRHAILTPPLFRRTTRTVAIRSHFLSVRFEKTLGGRHRHRPVRRAPLSRPILPTTLYNPTTLFEPAENVSLYLAGPHKPVRKKRNTSLLQFPATDLVAHFFGLSSEIDHAYILSHASHAVNKKLVGVVGLEPTNPKAPDLKSSVAANFTILPWSATEDLNPALRLIRPLHNYQCASRGCTYAMPSSTLLGLKLV